jgi:RNA polymerase sigma-70 factor, ECF subfamily
VLAAQAPVRAKPDSDEDLVNRTTAGEVQAFDVLVERYQDRVFNILARMCGSAEEAEDLAQDTFMQAYRALASFKQGSKFYTWLFRIAVNRGFSKRRQDVRRRTHEGGRLDAPAGRGEDKEQTLGAIVAERQSSDPAKRLDQELIKERVREGLREIDDDYRSILVLRDIEGLDYDAIAETLGITRAAVKSRLHRARQEMARLLKDLKNDSP